MVQAIDPLPLRLIFSKTCKNNATLCARPAVKCRKTAHPTPTTPSNKIATATMKQLLSIVWIALGALMLSFIGVKYHPVKASRMVIVKHRPSLHWQFRSPLGGSRQTMEELSPEQREQELLYRAFVKRSEPHTIDNAALVLFQVGLYLIVLHLLKLIFFRRKYRFKLGRFLSLNALGIAVALGMYQIYWSHSIDWPVVLGVQVGLNVLMIFPRLRKNAR